MILLLATGGLLSGRADAQGGLQELRVTVVDVHGEAIGNLWLGAFVQLDSTGVYQAQLTGTGGMATFELLEGSYHLHALTDRFGTCTVAGTGSPEGRVNAVLSASPGGSTQFQVTLSGRGSGGSSSWIPCRFDVPFYPIEGTLLAPSGDPIAGVAVRAFGEEGETFGPWHGPPTNAEGGFAVDVPAGAYVVEFHTPIDDAECELGFANPDGEHSYGLPRRVTVGGAPPARPLEVRLPADVESLCRPIQGTITTADGAPLASTPIAVDGRSHVAGAVRATQPSRADGTFTLYAPQGKYSVLVATDAGAMCEVLGQGTQPRGRAPTIDVGVNGLTDLRIVVSGTPPTQWGSFTCTFPPKTVATTLRPGWSLAGWTGGRTSVATLFATLPQLDAVYAWDSEAQAFQGAVRTGPDLRGTLQSLEPGMGLWLAVGGSHDVTWRRPILPGSALLSLSEGWNLVSWAGHDRVAAVAALASLGEVLGEAALWDATAGELVRLPTEEHPGSALPAVQRGDAVWVYVAAQRRWLQSGGVVPIIELPETVADTAASDLGARIEPVLTYFAERLGVLLPAIVWRGELGQDDISAEQDLCGGYAAGVIYLAEGCGDSAAHEYAHAIQEHLAGFAYESPAWMVEGTANRWSAEYFDAQAGASYQSHLADVVLPNTQQTAIPLEAMERTLFIDGLAAWHYSVAHLAVDWLVQQAGEDRTFAYFEELSPEEGWRATFERVFGVGVDAFYASFAQHRAEVAPPLPQIQGTVVDEDGKALAGVRLRAANRHEAWAESGRDGAFSFSVRDGAVLLEVHTPDGEGGTRHAGWYAEDGGFTQARQKATTIQIAGADVPGIVVRVPRLHWYRIAGVVLGPGGGGVSGLGIEAVPSGPHPGGSAETDATGAFDVPVLGGSFELRVHGETPDGRWQLGTYMGEHGFSPQSHGGTPVHVDAHDTTGIVIRLPFDPALAAWRRIEGVVLGPRGQPLEGINVDAFPTGHSPGLSDATGEDGIFSVAVLPGTFRLDLYGGLPQGWSWLGSYAGEEAPPSVEGEAASIEVRDASIAGITVRLPAVPAENGAGRIAGTVLDTSGRPLEGVLVEGEGTAAYSNWEATTDARGQFEAAVLDADYRVSFRLDRCFLGWYGGSGSLVDSREHAAALSPGSGDANALSTTAPDHCSRLSGAVVAPGDRPAAGIALVARAVGEGSDWWVETNESGLFDVVVPRGAYRLSLTAQDCPLDWTAEGGALRSISPRVMQLSLNRSVTGLTLLLADEPSLICHRIAGTIIGVDGEPVAGQWIAANPALSGPESYTGAWSAVDGAFALSVRDGTYLLDLHGDSFSACTVSDHEEAVSGSRARVTVAGADITGLAVTVSGRPPGSPGWVSCWFAE